MKRITKTQQIGAGSIVLLLLASTGYVFFLKHIYSLQDELVEIKASLAVVDEQEESKQEIVSLLSKTEDQREEILQYFVSIEDPTPFLELIESFAEDTGAGIEVETLSVAEVSDKTNTSLTEKHVEVVLLVEGTWESLFHLISLLETMPYVATISETAFSIDHTASSSVWRGQIELLCGAK